MKCECKIATPRRFKEKRDAFSYAQNLCNHFSKVDVIEDDIEDGTEKGEWLIAIRDFEDEFRTLYLRADYKIH